MSFRETYEHIREALTARVSRARPAVEDTSPAAPDFAIALRNVRLAKEYVQGITVLVDVSKRYQMPLPDPAFKNLHYLARLLEQAEQALSITPEDSHPCAAGFHASPSDKSAPCG